MATNPYKLDPTTRAGIIGQAEALAKKSGRTREQELHSYATGQGYDNAGIDTFLGLAAGDTDKWQQANAGQGGIAMPNAQPVTQQPAGIIGSATTQQPYTPASVTTPNQWTNLTNSIQNAVAQAPRPAAGGAAGGSSLLAAGSGADPSARGAATPFTQDQRTWIIGEANKRATANGTSVAAEIAAEATKNGRSLADVEVEMGYAPGTLTGGGAAGGGGAAPGGTPPAGTNALGGAVVPGVTPGAKLTDPSTWTTTADQTVAGQLPGIMDPNKPLMQRARTNARVSANSRGLLNSTIAESGADAATNDIALQIAQADAAQGSKVANFNASTQNQFTMADKAQGFDLAKMDRAAAITLGQMSAEQQNVIARLAVQQGYNLDTIKANQVNDLAKIAVQLDGQGRLAEQKYGYDKGLVEIQKASNLEIAGIDAKYRQQIQGSASATSIMNQLPLLIAKVMDNKDTTAEAKQAQINYYIATSTAALKLAGQFAGDVDLSGSLDGILSITQ